MANSGVKVIKKNVTQTNNQVRDLFLDSEKILLKIHKQGAFKARHIAFDGVTVKIQFNELNYRPLVLVYCQRKDHDGVIDTNYHLLDWEYHGATQEGWQRTKIYNNRFEMNYIDQATDVVGTTFDVFGYYYVFKEAGE